jgi:hypothetical protein
MPNLRSSITFVCLSAVLPISGQEFSRPDSQNRSMPEPAVYRIFMTHVAIFELAARAAEQQGKSRAPWRNHLLRKYGLTVAEQGVLADGILAYHDQMNGLRARIREEASAFNTQYFPAGKGAIRTPNPPPVHLASVHSLKVQQDSVTLAAKEQIHARLGDIRFGQIDGTVHEQITRRAIRR